MINFGGKIKGNLSDISIILYFVFKIICFQNMLFSFIKIHELPIAPLELYSTTFFFKIPITNISPFLVTVAFIFHFPESISNTVCKQNRAKLFTCCWFWRHSSEYLQNRTWKHKRSDFFEFPIQSCIDYTLDAFNCWFCTP